MVEASIKDVLLPEESLPKDTHSDACELPHTIRNVSSSVLLLLGVKVTLPATPRDRRTVPSKPAHWIEAATSHPACWM